MDNDTNAWSNRLPWPPSKTAHKYDRGHALIVSGGRMTGAARMASEACMRIGAGLCTVAAPAEALPAFQNAMPHIIAEPLASVSAIADHLKDERRNTLLIGPGIDPEEQPEALRRAIVECLGLKRRTVLDAGALTVFSGMAEALFATLHADCVLTPHAGEFAKLFGAFDERARIGAAENAARLAGCTVILKGAESVIASPQTETVVNRHATPWLATAGTGDVLAGMVAGLLAQGMAAHEAACAAVWLHGEAGLRAGPGLIAPDLIAQIPGIVRDFA